MEIVRYVAAEDVGTIINPAVVEGQIIGGIAQGIGEALLEELVYDDAGQPRTVTLADYLIPSALEIPRIELHHANTPSAALGGFKGCGEGSIIGAFGAVACAVADALSRQRRRHPRISRDPRAGAQGIGRAAERSLSGCDGVNAHADAIAGGLRSTTSSADAAKHIDQAVTAYPRLPDDGGRPHQGGAGAGPSLRAGAVLPRLLLPHAGEQGVLPRVKQTLDEIKPHLGAATRREQLHVKALEAWAAGDIMRACFHWEEILTDAPLDLMALKLHHTMTFYTGRSQVMRSVVSSVLGAWNDKVPEYGCVQGMYAYALEECGAYEDAERWGRQAVERNPGDLWALHSVAHVLEMQGRSAEGVKWLDYTPEQWAHKNPFKAHVWWHGALFLLAQGQNDRALDLYDKALCSVNSETYVDVSNQAALLKRIELSGVDVGERWQALAEHSEKRIHDHMLPFRDAHFCLALAANGNFEVARQHIEFDGCVFGARRRLARRGHARNRHPLVRRHDRLRGGRLRQGDRTVLAATARDFVHRRQPRAARPVRADHV